MKYVPYALLNLGGALMCAVTLQVVASAGVQNTILRGDFADLLVAALILLFAGNAVMAGFCARAALTAAGVAP